MRPTLVIMQTSWLWVICVGGLIGGVWAQAQEQGQVSTTTWTGVYQLPESDSPFSLKVVKKGSHIDALIDIPFAGVSGLNASVTDVDRANFHFSFERNGHNYRFSGRLADGGIRGTVLVEGKDEKDEGTFGMHETSDIPLEQKRSYVGDYRVGPGHYVIVTLWRDGRTLSLIDSTTSRWALLNPVSQNRFIAGPGLFTAVPVSLTAEFLPGRQILVTTGKSVLRGPAVHEYSEEEVQFSNGNVRLSGTLLIPVRHGKHPAIVYLHASGPQTRDDALHDGRVFALNGFAVLAFDKRGTGKSTGDWRNATFAQLAGDGVAAVELLRHRPDILGDEIGLFGASQGGYTAPLAASEIPVAFLILQSPPFEPPVTADLRNFEHYMEQQGLSAADVDKAVKFRAAEYAAVRSGHGWEEIEATADREKDSEWFKMSGYSPRSDPYWQTYKQIMDFDPKPVVQALRCPVLAFWGEYDSYYPAAKTMVAMKTVLSTRKGVPFEVHLFKHATHSLLWPVSTDREEKFATASGFVPAYYEMQERWAAHYTH